MQNKITQAVILSAGLGTRLREITGKDIPKVMVSLKGKPLLEHHIEQLKKHGICDFYINLFYLPEKITQYFGDGSKWDVSITYATESPEILGTAGGIKNFEHFLGEHFFVVYGDVYSELDYTKMTESYFRHQDAIAMTIVGLNDHPHDSDLVQIDEDLKFIKIYPKPNETLPENWRAMRTTFIFRHDVLSHIPEGEVYTIDHELLPALVERGEHFYGYETSDFIQDIGTPERYRAVEEYLKKI